MNLTQIQKIKTKRMKRVGQGHGSGRGKTAGRGTKGQKARGKVPLDFEGGGLPLIKRLPFLRGKNRNKAINPKPFIINVGDLNTLPKNTIVDTQNLVKYRFVEENQISYSGIKILGSGVLETPLTVKLPVSKGAADKIKKAGGSVEIHK